MSNGRDGTLFWISGPVVRAHIDRQIAMAEQVWVGEERLAAEVIDVSQTEAIIQVYEETAGLHVGEPLHGTGRPLSVTLGPGLIGGVFDGIQRPLEIMREQSGIFVARGERIQPLDTERQWSFKPKASQGDEVGPGSILGVVAETPLVEHRVLVPPGLSGTLVKLVGEGDYAIVDEVATIQDSDGATHSLTMVQHWPVRVARPVTARKSPAVPLITGQRVIDMFFPVAKGGTAAIPGPFGAGKTVTLHSLAKWSDADIIIYVGCGERGNEMTNVLEDFPKLEDPWTGHPLMERTILIANTSNMPVAARESSIYTGLTIAEYYRDQGYDVALMADSTSRWAQALREISGRLGEMPAEEGYPAYLSSRLAAFYERAGRVAVLGRDETGSVTIMGAVSPPGGDFSEPVTRHTQRFTHCFWALDRDLANQRHYPAISWEDSYSLYLDDVAGWWRSEVPEDWRKLRDKALTVLQQRDNLQRIVQLVGPEALTDGQRWVLDIARLLRDGFLDQNAYDSVDAYTVPEKQVKLLGAFLWLYDRGNELLGRGVPLARLGEELDMARLSRLRAEVPNDQPEQIDQVREEIEESFDNVLKTYSQ
jgi:V/A-type H+-transporting ATPase subunit A